MANLRTSVNVVAVIVIGSIFVWGTFVEEESIGTCCSACNMSYSIYIQFLRLQLCIMLLLDRINASELPAVRKSIRSLEKSVLAFETKNRHPFLLVFVVSVTAVRLYVDVRCDKDFPWLFHLTHTVYSAYTLVLALRFRAVLTPVREAYLRLRQRVGCANDGCWTSDPPNTLKTCLALMSRTMRIHERVDGVFGMEICLIQFAALSGIAVNTYLLAYVNLMGLSSIWINVYFVNDVECGVIICSYALLGHSVHEAAKDVLIEVCSFSFNSNNINYFSQVRSFVVNAFREPVYVTAMAFYPLSKESLINTVTTAIAFVFVSLQFNSLHSKFDIAVV